MPMSAGIWQRKRDVAAFDCDCVWLGPNCRLTAFDFGLRQLPRRIDGVVTSPLPNYDQYYYYTRRGIGSIHAFRFFAAVLSQHTKLQSARLKRVLLGSTDGSLCYILARLPLAGATWHGYLLGQKINWRGASERRARLGGCSWITT